MLAKLIGITKSIYHEISGVWFHKNKVDLGIQSKWSIFEKLNYNRLGFTNEDYYDFTLKHNDYHDYISFRERWRLEYLNGRFSYILGEKLMFERIFGHYIRVPHINCWVKNGQCIDMEAGEQTDILPLLMVKKQLIAKPTRSGGGGAGIHKILYDGSEYWVDQIKVSADELKKTIASWEEYIVVDFVKQAEYSNCIYPETTNSMRVVTVKHKDNNYDVALAFHRFGSNFSFPVDNICSGGLVSLVDIEHGTLSVAKRATEPEIEYDKHPDTGTQIEGVEISNWENIKDILIKTHQKFPYYIFLAWDVVIDDEGRINILEINRGSDLNCQIVRPLRKEKIGLFMQEYGLLDRH